jgi:hypothetical protein
MRWEQIARLGRELPGVGEGTWYGTPGLHVGGKFFVRLREDGRSVVFRLESVDEQEFLVAAQSDVYFITDHYRSYPAVLARLGALEVAECRVRLERAWRLKAPKSLAGQREHSRAGVSPAAPARHPARRRSPRARPRRPPSGGR